MTRTTTIARMISIAIAPLTLLAGNFRIDIDAGNKPEAGLVVRDIGENMTGAQANWLGLQKDRRLCFIGNATDKWERHSCSFISKQDGQVTLVLMGDDRIKLPWVAFDQLTIDGKNLDNPSFEQLRPNGRPTGWSGEGMLRTDGGAHGTNYVVTNHNRRFQQNLRVRRGEIIRLTFFCRAPMTPLP